MLASSGPICVLHAGHRRADGVERRRQIDGDNGIPLLRWEGLDRLHVLNACIVDQDVDLAEGRTGISTMRTMSAGFDMSAAEYMVFTP